MCFSNICRPIQACDKGLRGLKSQQTWHCRGQADGTRGPLPRPSSLDHNHLNGVLATLIMSIEFRCFDSSVLDKNRAALNRSHDDLTATEGNVISQFKFMFVELRSTSD